MNPDTQLMEWVAERDRRQALEQTNSSFVRSTAIRLLMFVVVPTAIYAGVVKLDRPSLFAGKYEMEQNKDIERSAAVINEWLEAQRKGRNGSYYWFPGGSFPTKPAALSWVREVTLFAVRSWEIVDSPSANKITVRVESSNKGGQPIIKLWTVRLHDHDGQRLIYSVEDPTADK